MADDKRVIFVHNNGIESNYRKIIAERMEAKGLGKIKDYTSKSPEATAKTEKPKVKEVQKQKRIEAKEKAEADVKAQKERRGM